MTDGIEPVTWSGRRAVVTFPAHVGEPEAAQAGEQLLGALRLGAVTLIADMSATKSCDAAVAGVVARIYQRAAAGQAELRLVISAPDVRHLVTADGMDRLVRVYSSLEAALAAGTPDWPAADDAPGPGTLASWLPGWEREQAGREAGSGPSVQADEAVLRQLIDALDDGIALTSQDGTIVLANRRLAAMLGYQPADLTGEPVEALVPAGLREAHRRHRAGYARRPLARPMADRARLVAVRRDGGTVPVTITLAPVPTASGYLVLAVVRDAAHAQHGDDLTALLSAVAAREAELSRELLDRVVASLFHAGLSLQAATHLPTDVARERISNALHHLDDTIHEIRDHIFRSRPPGAPL
jgi:PAS domain S-box-containing protein